MRENMVRSMKLHHRGDRTGPSEGGGHEKKVKRPQLRRPRADLLRMWRSTRVEHSRQPLAMSSSTLEWSSRNCR